MSNNKTNPDDTINAIVEASTDPYGGSRMECVQGGLTKREYFAAIAMQGLLSNYHNNNNPYYSARDAVNFADELIKALNNEQQ
jgi:hypothetical protein